MVGEISFRDSCTTGMKKKFRNLILKKGSISGLAKIGIFSNVCFFWFFVHNSLQNHQIINVRGVLKKLMDKNPKILEIRKMPI